MKTFFIIASGIADRPAAMPDGKTPLMLAHTPSLDALARCGCCGSILVLPDNVPLTRENGILALLGYDLTKDFPDAESLRALGKSRDTWCADGGPGYFILPKFSGHGVVISAHPEIVGIGKMALLRPVAVPASGDMTSALRHMADAAIEAMETNEFVLLHVECAAAMSRAGDLQGKIEAIESIDSDIITPIADYVWNAREQMNMVVATEGIHCWLTRRYERGEVPAVVYFNDDPPYDTKAFDEETVADGPLNAPLPGDLIRKLLSFEPVADDEEGL